MHCLRVNTTLFLAALLLIASGCGSASSGDTTGAGGAAPSLCAKDPRAEAYAVGLEQKSDDGRMKIRFIDASPAPPSKGTNQWTIQLLDGSDKPIDDATMTIKPFMPDHGHGSSITPQVTWMKSNGNYQITLVDLFMPGIWQITFNITPPGGAAPDAVVFTFCVDG